MTVTGYAKDVLVSADWAQQHLDDPRVRFVEVDVDTTAYEQSHLPGAGGG
jgi:thiosulfate/3-mercaptopyruvate sulfurtransferase